MVVEIYRTEPAGQINWGAKNICLPTVAVQRGVESDVCPGLIRPDVIVKVEVMARDVTESAQEDVDHQNQ